MHTLFRRMSVAAVVLGLAGALLQPFGEDADAGSYRGRGDDLQGAWRVQVNPRNCQTGATGPSFNILLAVHDGGTLTEVMNSPGFQPGQRTSGLGVWSHTHRNAYRAVWDAFLLFDSAPPSPYKRGVHRLMWDIEVHGDQMTFEAAGQAFDSDGNQVVATCASGTGTRFADLQDED
ncbi:MAG TPA: hypothetical protein VMO17_22015 [Terriglobia bacterium]|nr:hypothetical protein [Terriglobia bacterium]